jgi:hypothetical protein
MGEDPPPHTNCTGGWVGPGAGLDKEARGKILCLCRGSNPGRPVCNQTILPELPQPGQCLDLDCSQVVGQKPHSVPGN